MKALRAVLVLSASLPACGGRTLDAGADAGLDSESSSDGASFTDVGAFDSTAAACAAGGVELCGGACGQACSTCKPLLQGNGADSAYGICWSDLPDFGETPCALCDYGEGCVRRGSDSYVCVPLAACAALRFLGAGDVCWYSDKVPFDGRGVANERGCPAENGATTGIICGGDCPPCVDSTLDRCVGRGPDHPFGVCPALYASGDRTDVSHFPVCAVASGGLMTVPCPVIPQYPYACAVSPYPPGARDVAPRNGYCLATPICTQLATSLPGGVWCYDATGTRIAP